MHTLLDLHGNIPTFIEITSGTVHDVNILDQILPEPGAFCVMDRGKLSIKAFFGTSENAVKTQIWIAVSVYVLVAIVRKRPGMDASSIPNSTDS